nr:arginine--tRNA ligase [Rappaport israeli]
MKQEIQNALHVALTLIAKTHHIAEEELNQPIELERCKDPTHGDFATNLAMRYAKIFKMNPKELADQIVVSVPLIESVASMEVAGPGFVNIRLSHDSETAVLKTIMEQGDSYGRHKALQPQKILLEYVSANPTGPLHVGHGRGAAFGDTLANVLRANGHEVDEEYYVNDAGRQMDILALSVYWRYLEKQQKASALPKGLYQGEYVFELAEQLKETVGENLAYALEDWLSEMPQDWSEAQIEAGARDVFIDQAIADLKAKLGETDYRKVFDVALEAMVADIREDLAQFGVEFARWYSERSLYDEHKVEKALDILQEQGFLYEKEGAMWFRATDFGDEKDRVVRRENGVTTYFASDIAYHLDKYERGYDEMIDIFGADHHGYMARVRASLAALDLDPSQLKIILVQFAVLYKDGQKMQMSTRSGEFVTLRALREAVTSDAARFFM